MNKGGLAYRNVSIQKNLSRFKGQNSTVKTRNTIQKNEIGRKSTKIGQK